MKKALFRLLALALTLGMLLPLAACTPSTPPDATTTTPPPTTTGPLVTTDPHRTDPGVLSFAAIGDLADYSIVIAESAEDGVIEAAQALSALLLEKTGVSVAVKSDAVAYGESVPTDTKEILFGATNRAESFDTLRCNDFRIEKRGGRIVMAGGSKEALSALVEELSGVDAFFQNGVLMAPLAAYDFCDAYAIETLLLGGTDVSKYTIVRDSGHADTARHLQEKIREWTGHVLPIVTEHGKETVYEILIGYIERDGATYPTDESFSVKQVGTKLLLGGTAEYAGYFATLHFLNTYILSAPTASTLSVAVREEVKRFSPDLTGVTNMPAFTDFRGDYSLEVSAETVFERFLLAKAELPDEMTVLERVDIKNYPFSEKKAVYVNASKGDDANDGLSPETAFETIARALKYMEEKKGGVIYVMGGVYELEAPLSILGGHAGTPTCPLFIKAYGDKEATLTSNKQWADYDSGAWQVVDYETDPVAARIPERVKESGDDIYYSTLADLGLTKSDIAEISKSSPNPRLSVGGAAYTLAQFPNNTDNTLDWFYFTHTYEMGSVTNIQSPLYHQWLSYCGTAGISPSQTIGWQIRVINEKDDAKYKNSEGECTAQEMADELTSWVNTGNIWCYGNLYAGWENGYYNLSVNEEGIQNWHYGPNGERLLGGWRNDANGITKTVYTRNGTASEQTGYYFLKSKQPCSYGCAPGSNSAAGRNTLYFYNAIEALDIPGEWFYDIETGIVYLYPTDEFFGGAIEYAGAGSFPLIEAAQTSYVVVDGLTFNGSNSHGASFTKCDHITVQNCTFSNTKSNNLYQTNCTNFSLIYNDFSLSQGAMVSFGASNYDTSRPNLSVTNNYVQNNVFHDSAPFRDTGLTFGGSHVVVSHNFFHNTTIHTGYAIESIVEYNRFDGGSKTTTDGGMIYFSTYGTRGNHVRNNLMHRFNASGKGVYFDTETSGCYAYNNIISTMEGKTQSIMRPWYSSTGNGNVCFENIIIMRNPNECANAGLSGGDEALNESFSGASDRIHQSALFYYAWSDNGYIQGNNPRRYIFSYNEAKEAGLLGEDDMQKFVDAIGINGRASFYQAEHGGESWMNECRKQISMYLESYDREAYTSRFPGYINSLYSLKMIVEMYETTEDYHIRYFYMPAELSNMTHTFKLPEGTLVTIPTYQYKENNVIKTVPQRTVTPEEVGSEWVLTLTYEEIASIERMERAPCNSVISNNVILGGTPAELNKDGQPVGTDVDESKTIVVAETKGFDIQASTIQENNFLYFVPSDIVASLEDYDYTIDDGTWDWIERTMNMGEGFRDGFMPMFEATFGLSDKKFDYFQYDD